MKIFKIEGVTMKIKYYLIFIISFLINLAQAQITYSPRYLSLGMGAGALERGAASALMNPALPVLSAFSELTLMQMQATVVNNSFSVSKYNKYFTTGELLTEQDINDILQSIPNNGLQGNFGVKVGILGITSNGLSYNLYVDGGGKASIPKEIAELILKGNEIGRSYSFNNFKGEGWIGLVNALSYGTKIEQLGHIFDFPLLGEIDYWSFGATAKYILGMGYGKFKAIDASFMTQNTFIKGNFSGNGYVSEGGRGYGLDLGTALSIEDGKWIVSASLLNVLGGIKWTKGNRQFSYIATLDSINLGKLNSDSIHTSDTDTTFRNFYTYLPTKLYIGISYKLDEIFSFGFEYEQSLRKRLGEIFTPRFGFSTEIRYLEVLPVRFGMSIGGNYGFVLGTGIGLDLRAFTLDLSVANYRGFFGNGSKGLSLGLGMAFRF